MDSPSKNSMELDLNSNDSWVEFDLFKRSARLSSDSSSDNSQTIFEVNRSDSSFDAKITNAFDLSRSSLNSLNNSIDNVSIISISRDSFKSSNNGYAGATKINMTGRVLIKPSKNTSHAKKDQFERLGCICK